MRFIANKLGRLLTLGKIFSTQTLKGSPASCIMFPEHHSALKYNEKKFLFASVTNSISIIFRAQILQCTKTKFPRFICFH